MSGIWPIIPKSTNVSAQSRPASADPRPCHGVMKMLPGWASPWKKPSTKSWSNITVANSVATSAGSMPAARSASRSFTLIALTSCSVSTRRVSAPTRCPGCAPGVVLELLAEALRALRLVEVVDLLQARRRELPGERGEVDAARDEFTRLSQPRPASARPGRCRRSSRCAAAGSSRPRRRSRSPRPLPASAAPDGPAPGTPRRAAPLECGVRLLERNPELGLGERADLPEVLGPAPRPAGPRAPSSPPAAARRAGMDRNCPTLIIRPPSSLART